MPLRGAAEFYSTEQSPTRRILDLRAAGLEPVRLIGRYRYSRAQAGLAPHSHGNMIEICYLESGQQLYEVAGKRFPVLGGEVFITFPHERHSTAGQPESRGVLYWILISLAHPQDLFLNLPSDEGKALLRRLLSPPSRVFRGRKTLAPTLRRMFEIFDGQADPLRQLELRNLLVRFLLDVAASSKEARFSRYSSAVGKAIGYVDAHPDRRIALGELARHVALSLPHFKAKFRAEVGLPPADFITRHKIERARRLLADRRAKVLDVALALGFRSSQHFATTFKQYTGKTPRGRGPGLMNGSAKKPLAQNGEAGIPGR